MAAVGALLHRCRSGRGFWCFGAKARCSTQPSFANFAVQENVA